jgi:hypothetical protein
MPRKYLMAQAPGDDFELGAVTELRPHQPRPGRWHVIAGGVLSCKLVLRCNCNTRIGTLRCTVYLVCLWVTRGGTCYEASAQGISRDVRFAAGGRRPLQAAGCRLRCMALRVPIVKFEHAPTGIQPEFDLSNAQKKGGLHALPCAAIERPSRYNSTACNIPQSVQHAAYNTPHTTLRNPGNGVLEWPRRVCTRASIAKLHIPFLLDMG